MVRAAAAVETMSRWPLRTRQRATTASTNARPIPLALACLDNRQALQLQDPGFVRIDDLGMADGGSIGAAHEVRKDRFVMTAGVT